MRHQILGSNIICKLYTGVALLLFLSLLLLVSFSPKLLSCAAYIVWLEINSYSIYTWDCLMVVAVLFQTYLDFSRNVQFVIQISLVSFSAEITFDNALD